VSGRGKLHTVENRWQRIGGRLLALLVRSTAPPLWLGGLLAATTIVAETIVVVLLKQITSMDEYGVIYLLGVLLVATVCGFSLAAITAIVSAFTFGYFRHWPTESFDVTAGENWAVIVVFLVAALLANALANFARSRAVEADQRRREADLAAELARLMLHAGDLRSAMDSAAQRLAQVLELPWAAVVPDAVSSDEHRRAIRLVDGAAALGTLLVPPHLPKPIQQRLQERVVPSLQALLAAEQARAATNRALDESRDLLERFNELSSDLLGIGYLRQRDAGPLNGSDRRAYWKRINGAFERTFGYPSQVLLSRPFIEFVHPDDVNLVTGVLDELNRGDRRMQFEHRCISRDGSVVWVEWNVVANHGFMYVAGRDVTDRRRAQDRLHEAHRMVELSRDELGVLADQQSALRQVATLIARGAAPSEVFSAVATQLARCLAVPYAALWRYEADGSAVRLAAQEPGSAKPPEDQRFTLDGDNVVISVLRTGRPARMDDYQDAAGAVAARMRAAGVRSAVGAPIAVDSHVWGALAVGSGQPEPMPRDTEARLSEFADLVATALANVQGRADLAASRARIVTAADDARRRIERDLHDGAQQRLVSVGLKLRLTQDSVPSGLGALQRQISNVIEDVESVSAELREISRGIHPAILSRGGLGPALKMLARRSPVPVNLDARVGRRLPDYAEVAAYYVVAEALTNVAKHAAASEVNVVATVDEENLAIEIRDDGIGGATPGKGSGLIGLVDRVEALGGHLEVRSRVGEGTTLLVTIPCRGK
jgi:PAS domain S-box-containing protein